MPSSFLASPSATIESLKRWNLHTKKSLGQHFLVDDNVVARILELSEVGADETVLEVGPGIGTLTVALLGCGANVVAVERDTELRAVLQENASIATDGADLQRLAVLGMDALDLDAGQLEVAASGLVPPRTPRKFVANLPYSVAATLVLEFFQKLDCIQTACVMVQAEVADRICASPGTKDYGAYTVKVRLLAEPGQSFTVSPGCFLPQPRVMSKVIRLDRIDAGSQDTDARVRESASTMADAAFFQRRKTIRNSMQAYMSLRGQDPSCVPAVLEAAGIDPKSRGESHDLDEFLEMGKAYLELLG